MNWKRLVFVLALCVVLVLGSTAAATKSPTAAPAASLLTSGLNELQGSTVGPDGALYVTAPLDGMIWRVDPKTGAATVFASGLPKRIPGLYYIGSGVVDVAFLDGTAYALVTGVGPDFDPSLHDIVGIYRVDGPSSFTVVADLGAWSIANPPPTEIFVPSGFQYALQPYRGGFIVTDGHHNRVLQVTLDGAVTELVTLTDVVPTGLAVRGNTIYFTEAGPIPHLPENGKVMSFSLKSPTPTQVASGAGLDHIGLFVDVEFGLGNSLYALAQGDWNGPYEGTPADPNTGSAPQGQLGWHHINHCRETEPADFDGVHWEHSLCGQPRRPGLGDR